MTRDERRKNWLDKGLCKNCGCRPYRPGRLQCKVCATRVAKRAQERRRERIQAGLCIRCGRVASLSGFEKCQACLKDDANRHRNSRIDEKLEAINVYGGPQCACLSCGETNLGFLTLDHINGNGNEHRRSLGNGIRGRNIYTWLRKNNYPSGFQVLCFNCNCGKNSNHGVCPHLGSVTRFDKSFAS